MGSGPVKRVKKARELAAALASKGFRAREGDHTFYFLYAGGRKTSVRTKISHGAEEYGPGLLSQMSKQLHLRSHELDDFVECPLSHRGYLELLVQRGTLPAEVLDTQ